MIKANKEDRFLVTGILAGSFKDNQSVNYLVRQGPAKPRRLLALMAYSFNFCYLSGEVWLSDDKQACALILFPQLTKPTFGSIWLDLKLIFQVIGLGHLPKVIHRQASIRKLQTDGDICHLWFIGTDPLYQRRGTGSRLLGEVLDYAAGRNLSVCLETSTTKNLAWYQRFGFQIYNQLQLTYTLYFLKYDPRIN